MPYKFTFKEDDEDKPQFQCDIECFQCKHVNLKTHKRCRRKQYIGFDLCFQHLATDCHLKIKPSHIRNAGKGLFAYNGTSNKDIVFRGTRSKGDRIVAYNAEVITHEENDRRYGHNHTSPYGAYINKEFVEDAACRRSVASTANHTSWKKSNAKLYTHKGRVYLRAKKDIYNGDEILIDYGDDYDLNEEGVSHQTKYVRR